ncbi:MAG: hypothetical protein JW843_05485 [Candidatus Aminicenantes bacterium]|nr:hypothetical protein [Candidatus Aminicenantes bacterium]
MFNKLTVWSKAVAFLLAAVLSAGAGIPLLAGGDDEAEKDICRRALDQCLADVAKSGVFAKWLISLTTVSSCLLGYDFCRKFVRILAEEMA